MTEACWSLVLQSYCFQKEHPLWSGRITGCACRADWWFHNRLCCRTNISCVGYRGNTPLLMDWSTRTVTGSTVMVLTDGSIQKFVMDWNQQVKSQNSFTHTTDTLITYLVFYSFHWVLKYCYCWPFIFNIILNILAELCCLSLGDRLLLLSEWPMAVYPGQGSCLSWCHNDGMTSPLMSGQQSCCPSSAANWKLTF